MTQTSINWYSVLILPYRNINTEVLAHTHNQYWYNTGSSPPAPLRWVRIQEYIPLSYEFIYLCILAIGSSPLMKFMTIINLCFGARWALGNNSWRGRRSLFVPSHTIWSRTVDWICLDAIDGAVAASPSCRPLHTTIKTLRAVATSLTGLCHQIAFCVWERNRAHRDQLLILFCTGE